MYRQALMRPTAQLRPKRSAQGRDWSAAGHAARRALGPEGTGSTFIGGLYSADIRRTKITCACALGTCAEQNIICEVLLGVFELLFLNIGQHR